MLDTMGQFHAGHSFDASADFAGYGRFHTRRKDQVPEPTIHEVDARCDARDELYR
jgi:hypothetical protein